MTKASKINNQFAGAKSSAVMIYKNGKPTNAVPFQLVKTKSACHLYIDLSGEIDTRKVFVGDDKGSSFLVLCKRKSVSCMHKGKSDYTTNIPLDEFKEIKISYKIRGETFDYNNIKYAYEDGMIHVTLPKTAV